jgi:NhaP-type Na+/H+ or K+/H+ antiporter
LLKINKTAPIGAVLKTLIFLVKSVTINIFHNIWDNHMKKQGTKLLIAFFSLVVVGLVSGYAPLFMKLLENSSDRATLTIFFSVATIFFLSFVVFYISRSTRVPSFVVAIFFGLAAQSALAPIVDRHEVLGALVGFGATLILFSGGLETTFYNFRKLFWKIALLSFPGLLLTAFLFSSSVNVVSNFIGVNLSVVVAVLLGAILASTDPAAIIPVLKRLRFFNHSTKDIIISESAVTDVTGTLLTVSFLSLVGAGVSLVTVGDWYGKIFSESTAMMLWKQLAYGIIFGVVGYLFLELLDEIKEGHDREFEADSAFFLFTPVIIFTIALALGGSGYLAAFISGLLFNINKNLHTTEKFFNHMVDGFFKPTIFILLGALVHPAELVQYAFVGLVSAFVFMFVIRPITVFSMLGVFSLFGKNRVDWRNLLFISFVRETGAIPAVLLVTVASMRLPNTEGLIPVGMWVILLTLIVEPLLTPLVAKKLKVAEEIVDEGDIDIKSEGQSTIVIGARGSSFVERMPFVIQWAKQHNIGRISVLMCLEYKYTPEILKELEDLAQAEFKKAKDLLGAGNISFSFISRKGFLQDNIQQLSDLDSSVVAIFVGKKMLDYRLDEIKELRVPLYFI